MAAERTPSRRKQCIFRRAFQRFPFSKCERKCRASSSYDVFHDDPSRQTAEKWSPTDAAIASFSSPRPLPLEGMHSTISTRIQLPNGELTHTSHEKYEENGISPTSSRFHMDNVSHQGLSSPPPYNTWQRHPNDCVNDFLNVERSQNLDSPYSNVPQPQNEDPPDIEPPPSPSVCSMETDMEVDPETGERALD
ncbi:uncharacterized protein WCC33_017550 [Rhinophrynus dorsalis]